MKELEAILDEGYRYGMAIIISAMTITGLPLVIHAIQTWIAS